MVGSDVHRLMSDDVPMEIRVRGVGEPVLFVHGAMGDECAAVLQEPALTGHYRLIDYHRRGYGDTPCHQVPVTVAQQTADCLAIMRAMGIERAHLVGQSYGGAVILQVALDAPEAAHTLALLEPALPLILFRAPEGGESEEEDRVGALYMSGNKAGAIDTFAQGVISPDYRAAFDSHLPSGWFERWVAATDTVFQSDLPDLQAWQFTREEAARISQPVLNLRGVNTTADFQEIHDTIRAWMPHAESDVIPDACHAMMQMNPSATAERLAAFFSKYPLQVAGT